MSAIYNNEYIISSTNSINDNKYNAQKMAKSPSHKLKRLLKPILRMLRQKTINGGGGAALPSVKKHQSYDDFSAEYDNDRNNSIESCTATSNGWSSNSISDYDCAADNTANEELETRIFREIEQCPNDAAVYICNGADSAYELHSVRSAEKFVPVHFARTEAGTFFWTTIQRPIDHELVQPIFCQSGYQQPELQYGDRWVQA